jgi:hypothetical protein
MPTPRPFLIALIAAYIVYAVLHRAKYWLRPKDPWDDDIDEGPY